MTKGNPISDQYRRITPTLVVNGAARALEYYAEVFDTTERMRFPGPGGTIAHAELVLGDSVLIVEDPSTDPETKAPAGARLEGSPTSLYVFVDDVDATIERAVELGATQVRAPQDQSYGERAGFIVDPFGHGWTIASHAGDVAREEMTPNGGDGSDRGPGMNPLLDSYNRCVDQLESALAAVPAGRWEDPTPCAEWSLRDIAGHVIWGQRQLRCWAIGEDYRGLPGGPGTPHPAAIAPGDPLPRWEAARAATDATLAQASLDQTLSVPGLGEVPLAAMVVILTNDSLIHAWDLRQAVDGDVRLPDDLVAASQVWARENVTRAPGFFGPELRAPAGADEQSRWLAYLGRDRPQPAASHEGSA